MRHSLSREPDCGQRGPASLFVTARRATRRGDGPEAAVTTSLTPGVSIGRPLTPTTSCVPMPVATPLLAIDDRRAPGDRTTQVLLVMRVGAIDERQPAISRRLRAPVAPGNRPGRRIACRLPDQQPSSDASLPRRAAQICRSDRSLGMLTGHSGTADARHSAATAAPRCASAPLPRDDVRIAVPAAPDRRLPDCPLAR